MTEIMGDFYKRLYTSEVSTDMECIHNFLKKLNLPSLPEKDQGILGRPITCVEVVEAIKSLQSGQAPGPDGFGPGFFKKFQNLLKCPLTKMYLHAVEQHNFPPTLYGADISLNLKKGLWFLSSH